jgi:hypothetical protein
VNALYREYMSRLLRSLASSASSSLDSLSEGWSDSSRAAELTKARVEERRKQEAEGGGIRTSCKANHPEKCFVRMHESKCGLGFRV